LTETIPEIADDELGAAAYSVPIIRKKLSELDNAPFIEGGERAPRGNSTFLERHCPLTPRPSPPSTGERGDAAQPKPDEDYLGFSSSQGQG